MPTTAGLVFRFSGAAISWKSVGGTPVRMGGLTLTEDGVDVQSGPGVVSGVASARGALAANGVVEGAGAGASGALGGVAVRACAG
jgi:hypothetical protein